MSSVYFYDLPVYRLSYDQYNALMDQRLAAQVERLKFIPGYEPPKETVDGMSQRQYEEFGPWRFNETIGYIRLHFLGSQVRGEYFSAEKKRNLLGRKKVFVYRTWKLAAEVDIHRGQQVSNERVWQAIQEYVARCRKELKKGRVIDDSLLQTVGPYTDWLALLGWSTSR
jgi:hypothetical protein